LQNSSAVFWNHSHGLRRAGADASLIRSQRAFDPPRRACYFSSPRAAAASLCKANSYRRTAVTFVSTTPLLSALRSHSFCSWISLIIEFNTMSSPEDAESDVKLFSTGKSSPTPAEPVSYDSDRSRDDKSLPSLLNTEYTAEESCDRPGRGCSSSMRSSEVGF
ncbi:hypothetical protein ANCCAN_26120, partial [Ancylostoma caninum]